MKDDADMSAPNIQSLVSPSPSSSFSFLQKVFSTDSLKFQLSFLFFLFLFKTKTESLVSDILSLNIEESTQKSLDTSMTTTSDLLSMTIPVNIVPQPQEIRLAKVAAAKSVRTKLI
jgi:hypothetical protein